METDPTRAQDPSDAGAAPRPPAFRGDAHFRDDRFDDERTGAAYGHAPISDALSADDRPLADPWTRLGAQLLDGVLYAASVVPGVILLALGGGFSAETPFGSGGGLGFGLMGLGFLALFFYQMVLLSRDGQTLGKRFLKLRVVDVDDGSNPGFVRAVLLRVLAPGVISNVPLVGFLFTIADALFVFRDDRRCIHDHFAKTVVVTESGSTF